MRAWTGSGSINDDIAVQKARLEATYLSDFYGLFVGIAHSAFKNDKSILIESTYERFLVHFDGVSSFGNVVDIDGTGSEKISTLNKLKAYLALFSTTRQNFFPKNLIVCHYLGWISF